MEDIFNTIKQYAKNAVNGAEKITTTAVEKTKSTIDTVKYKYSVSELEAKVNEILAQLGMNIYTEYVDGAEFDEEINEKCEKIKELKQELEDIKEKIAESKNSVFCPSCNEMISNDAVFCPKCGHRVKSIENDEFFN